MKYNYRINLDANNSHTTIIKKIKPQSRVLEFGPATGYMTEYMEKELNCSVTAIEIDSDAAKIASKYTDKMIVCDVESYEWRQQLKGELFDYILFADVLEHLKNPWEVLSIVKGYLKQEGQILISIPNIAHNSVLIELLNGKFEYRKLGLLDNTHLRFFTKSSLIDMINISGLHLANLEKVIIAPEVTELNTTYQSLPESVAEYLRKREDGNVYQYVLTVNKTKGLETNKDLNLNPEIYVSSDYVEIFPDFGSGFKAENMIAKPIKFIGKDAVYKYKIPVSDISSFRLDPSNSPGVGFINGIYLKDIESNVSLNLIGNSKIEAMNSLNLVPLEHDKILFLSLNNDPQLKIDIPKKFRLKNLELEINLSFSKFYDNNQSELIGIFLNYYKNEVKDLANKNDNIKESLNNQLAMQIEKFQYTIEKNIMGYEKQKNDLVLQIKNITESNELLNRELGELKNVQIEYEKLLNSRSWKITSIFRKLKKIIKYKR